MREEDMKTDVSFGLVLRVPIEVIPLLKRKIFEVEGVRTVYYRISAKHLVIKEEEDAE